MFRELRRGARRRMLGEIGRAAIDTDLGRAEAPRDQRLVADLAE
jgi:hypothetical protein